MIGGSRNGVAKVMYRRTTRCLALVKIDIHIFFSFLAELKEVYAKLELDARMVIIPVGFYRNPIKKWRSPQGALFEAQEMIE